MTVKDVIYVEANKFPTVVSCIDEELGNKWEHLLEFAFDVTKPFPDGSYESDINGVLMKDIPDVKSYYLPVHIHDQVLPTEISIRFTKTIELIKGMAGIYGLFLAVIGPNSVVPYHTDDRSNNTNTILIGVRVPSTNVDDIGFEINSTKYNIDKSIIFSSSIPHKAWNNTNQWWVSAILIADINTLKLKDTA
jgi:hypothetical protein